MSETTINHTMSSTVATSGRRFWLRWELTVPCLLILLFAAPLVLYRVPSNFDTLDESFEPLRTLKFVHSKGRAYHKWGPMPAFVYGPVYAVPLAYWYLSGDLAHPSDDYPYGFARPHEQEGLLIILARLAGLTIAVGSVAYLGWALARVTGSKWAVFLALLFCISTSPELVFKFVATKPDGLMLAFLAAAMGVYALVVSEGLTRRRGVALSLLAVFSISCKELTAPAFVLPYVGIAIAGWLQLKGSRETRRRFWIDYVLTIAAGLIAYAMVNVVYAPSTWQARMHEWLGGPGKDPAVWAPPGYSATAYLGDVLHGLLWNFDAGGLAVFGLAAVVSIVAPVRHRVMLWLPTASFLAIVVATAGYMPAYFLGPLNVTAALPVAAALAHLGRTRVPSPIRAAGALTLTIAAIFNLWGGNAAWARAMTLFPATHERYCLASVAKDELVFTGNYYVRQPGADRLSYLGFNIDDRPLGALMSRPERMPDVVLVSREELTWLADFVKRPARNEMMKLTGFSYDRFEGFEPLGYRLVEVVTPRRPWPLNVRVFPWYRVPLGDDLMVYRRVASQVVNSEATR